MTNLSPDALRRALPVAVLAMTGLLGAAASQAQTSLLYVGGSVGPARVQYDPQTFYAGSSSTGYQIDAGTRPLPFLAAELSYLGLPRAFSGANYVDTSGAGLSGLAILPIPFVDVFGKIGVLDWRSRVRSQFVDEDRSGEGLSYGGGAGTHLGNLGVRVEFESFDVAHTRTAELTSIGLTWALL